MRGGSLPPALLCLALGLLLAYVPRKWILPSIATLAFVSAFVVLVGFPAELEELVFAVCWASVVGTALLLHWPSPIPMPVVLGLSANAGLWSGAVIALSGTPLDLAVALPVVLVCIPAGLLLKTPLRLGIKIIGSWLVAVALLMAAVPLIETPGYAPDHYE